MTSPVAARFVGSTVHRKEDRRTAHRPRPVRRRRPGARHAARGVPPQRRSPRRGWSASTPRRHGSFPASSRVFTWSRLPGPHRRGVARDAGGAAGGAPPAGHHRRPPRRRSHRVRRRREPIHRRGRLRADRRRATSPRSRPSTTPRRPTTPNTSSTPAGVSQSNAMIDVPFTPMSADLDEAFSSARARRRDDHRAEPLPVRADGDAAASWPAGTPGSKRWTSSAPRSPSTRPATSSPATSRCPKRRCG